MFLRSCPLDGSKLVCFGGRYAFAGQFDVEGCYCPPCDVGFVSVVDPQIAMPELFLCRRSGKNLQLEDADSARAATYRKRGLATAMQDLIPRIESFLRWREKDRFGKRTCCPMDGGPIPVVGEVPYRQETLKVAYCHYCNEIFLYRWSKDYGWEVFASFTPQRDGYRFKRGPDNDAERVDVEKSLLQLPKSAIVLRFKF